MPRLRIHHKTEYRYARPVAFGEHRVMLRPRDGHDLRVLDGRLDISPEQLARWAVKGGGPPFHLLAGRIGKAVYWVPRKIALARRTQIRFTCPDIGSAGERGGAAGLFRPRQTS